MLFRNCSFEIAGMFSSKLKNKAITFAEKQSIPYAAMDIKEYYTSRGAKIIDMEVREDFDHEQRSRQTSSSSQAMYGQRQT